MASIILQSTRSSKGILILKNNELPFINRDSLKELASKYHIGLYFGSFQENKKEISESFSFTISAKGLLKNFYNIPNIDLQGWNFSSSKDLHFNSLEINPIFDIQSIAYNGYRKQLRHMLLFFKLYIEKFPESMARVLAVHDPSHPLHDHGLSKFYKSVIPYDLRDKLILHKVNCYSNKKLSQNEVRAALMESRVNVIGSRDEGAPRILSESLALKRPVLLSSATKMASTNKINDLAFLKFYSSKDFLNKASILKKISQNFNPITIYPEFFLENSINLLAENLERICKVKKEIIINYFYKKNLQNLRSHYLTGHTKTINFNPNLLDDVCTDKYDFKLLVNKLLKKEKLIVSSDNKKKNPGIPTLRKIRLKLYYLKVKVLYLINCPISSNLKELDKKHFKKLTRLV